MIQSSAMTTGLFGGFIDSYARAVSGARFPPTFHLMCGAAILGAIVGDRCYIDRPGFTLRPQVWPFFIAPSGVGKSAAMMIAYKAMKIYANHYPERGLFIRQPLSETKRGLMKVAMDWQRNHNPDLLEGIYFLDEISTMLGNQAGMESMSQFFIKAYSGDDIEETTRIDGQMILRGWRAPYVIASSMDMLRPVITVQEFTGGFLYRFFLCNEIRRPNTPEGDIDWDHISDLMHTAHDIYRKAPWHLTISDAVKKKMRVLERQSEEQGFTQAMSGYFNRVPEMALKLGLVRALSQARYDVTEEDLGVGATILRRHITGPTEEFVREIAYGKKKQEIFGAADNLHFLGPRGQELAAFKRSLPGTTRAAVDEAISFLSSQGLLFQGTKNGKPWVWRHADWQQEDGIAI